MRHGCQKTSRDTLHAIGVAAGFGCCVWLFLQVAAAAPPDPPSGGVSPWATGGAPANPGTSASTTGMGISSAVPVTQAFPAPGAVVQGGTIPAGWQPQAVPYQSIGSDGRPITVYVAPTYVFTYAIGPPVLAAPMAPAPAPPARVNRRQAYGQPGMNAAGWNYATQGAAPVPYTLPPPTVARYQPQPYQFPPGSRELSGTALVPPALPAQPSPPVYAATPPPGFGVPPAPATGLAAPPSEWVQVPPETSPVADGGGEALAAVAPPAIAAASVAAAAAPPATVSPPPATVAPPLVSTTPAPAAADAPLEPVAQPARSGVSAVPVSRSATPHMWRVVGVHDGDTVTCLDDTNAQQKVRLAEIDAPELGQDFGKVSRDSLAEMVFGKTVQVTDDGKDRYGRWVGHLNVNGTDVNRQMIATGNAWHYTDYSNDLSLEALQQQAQQRRLGLWSQDAPTPPWDYRQTGKAPKNAD